MDTDGIKRRIGWLDELSRGLAKEVVLMKAANDPLLYLERKAYLRAIRRTTRRGMPRANRSRGHAG